MMGDDDVELQLAAAVEAFFEASRKGNPPDIHAFAEAYPDCRRELLGVLSAVADMEQLGRSSRRLSPSEASFPESLGGFRLLERLGCGGMGVVFRAEQVALHREVAVKVLSPSWNGDERHCQAFQNESRLIAGLRHTNIVEVFGAGEEAGYRYYVMGLIEGRGVSAEGVERVFPGRPYRLAVAQVGLQAAEGLAYAHSHGILHRDVKPGNLLLDREGVLHVSDFGLSTALNSGEEAPLVTQSHDGTLRYMAPERLNKGLNSFAGDQYSLGLTLYELVTRKPAFREAEPGSLIRRVCSSPVPPLKGEGELGAIINKSISFEPEARYDSMEDMAADLRRYLGGEPVKARPSSWLRRYVMWLRRRPALAAWSHAAALSVLLLMASVSIGYVRVSRALSAENEERLRAETNARIADGAMERIFSGFIQSPDGENWRAPTKADARLMQDLLPYYEQIAEQTQKGAEAKVANACRILAAIARQTGDVETAEKYYRRAVSMLPAYTTEALDAKNGLVSVLMLKRDGRAEARRLLRDTIRRAPLQGLSVGAQTELVRSALLAARFAAPRRRGVARPPAPLERKSNSENAAPRGEEEAEDLSDGNWSKGRLHVMAAERLRSLLDREPSNASLRLLQAEILGVAREPEVSRILAPHGETPFAILDSLLREMPDQERYQLEFVRMALGTPYRGRQRVEPDESLLSRAAAYSERLLSSNPTDGELIMLYIVSHDRYAELLSGQGKAEEARRENSRTLGVLSMLTSRDDFPGELRQRLIILTAMHPTTEEGKKQQEEELSVLLQSYEENRRRDVRARLKRMRERRKEPHPPHVRHGRDDSPRGTRKAFRD